MISVGIDAGMDNTKVVMMNDEGAYVWSVLENGLEPTDTVVAQALDEALTQWNLRREDVDIFGVTGVGQENIRFIRRQANESETCSDAAAVKSVPLFFCIAQGANHMCPGVETVVDMGSRSTLALCCEDGIVYKTAASEKCASGAGAYLNMVSSFLDMDLNQMNRMYFETDQEIILETKCAVFAESEIISLVHRKVPVEAIVRGAFNGLAHRVRAQILGLPLKETICVTGGTAMLPACLDALKNAMKREIIVPEEPRIVGALGAALLVRSSLF